MIFHFSCLACITVDLRYSDSWDRILNRVIPDIFVAVREITVNISDSIETRSPVEFKIVRVVSLCATETIKITRVNPFPNKPWFLRVCSTSLSKTLWEKEKLLVTSNFSFSHSVFYLFRTLSAIFIKTEIVICKLCQFGRV